MLARSLWRGGALLLACLVLYSRLSRPRTAVVHIATSPPESKHRPPGVHVPSAASPPAAGTPERSAAEGEAHSSAAPSKRVTLPEAAHEHAADTVHVALAADSLHFQALPGAILSAANRSSAALAFHVLVPAEQLAAATSALECFGLAPTRAGGAVPMSAPDCPSVTVLPYRPALGAPVRVIAKADVTGNLASPLNFARFELPRLLPELRRLIYLDADVAVQADLLELWQARRGEG